jgi:hypothetical protein
LAAIASLAPAWLAMAPAASARMTSITPPTRTFRTTLNAEDSFPAVRYGCALGRTWTSSRAGEPTVTGSVALGVALGVARGALLRADSVGDGVEAPD